MGGTSASGRKALERAWALHRNGQLAEAERLYQSVLQRDGANVDALHRLAMLRAHRGDFEGARRDIDRALGLEPARADLHFLRGAIAGSLGLGEQALESYAEALALKPDFIDALVNMGDALLRAGRAQEALALCDRALALRPGDLASLNNRGNALLALKRHAEALDCFDRVQAQVPDNVDVRSNRAAALLALGRLDEAGVECRAVLAARPSHAMARLNLGRTLGLQGKTLDALHQYDEALALRPDEFDAWCERALLLRELQRYREAADSQQRAIALRPDASGAWSDFAATLLFIEDYPGALAACDRALALDAGLAATWSNRGLTLEFLERHEQAIPSYERALALDPDTPYADGRLAWLKLKMADWRHHASAVERILQNVRGGQRATEPFELLFFTDRAADQLACARICAADRYPRAAAIWSGDRYKHARIRLAYVSADFRDHPASYLLAELFEKHDRSRFELYGISLGPEDSGAVASRVSAAFEHFLRVRERTDRDIAELMREQEIDIAVDLLGYTSHRRTAVFAMRPCPVQANYLGFPATMGTDFHDYIIADPFLIPAGSEAHYSEKVARLPDTFQANDTLRRHAEGTPTRAALGLPEQAVVYCSFNKSPKINPETFDVWMHILRAVSGSVLWLWGGDTTLEQNLRREANSRGVDPSRLVFAPGVSYPRHLARLRCADIGLDTFPFNGGATSSDALWCGVPIVTRAGHALASRMTGSLLTSVGLPGLIADSPAHYAELAIRVGSDAELRARTRETLAANRRTQPLFDAERFRRHIEAAYETMWRRYQAGQAPESFTVSGDA
jgi:protein O-GlcNAc transferase